MISTTIDDKSDGKVSTFRERIRKVFVTTKQKYDRRKTETTNEKTEKTSRYTRSNAADGFRVHDENALNKHSWKQENESSCKKAINNIKLLKI